jgi:hypothetical protein
MPQPDSASLFERATALQNAGRHAEALPLLDLLAARHPEAAPVHRNRAVALSALNRPDAVLASLDRLAALEPGDLDLMVWKGATLQLLSRLDEARNVYESVLAVQPAHADALYNIATILQHQGKLDEAEPYYRRTLEAKPDQPLASFNLSIILQEQTRFDEAMEFLDRAIAGAGHPTLRADMEWNKGQLLLLTGRMEEGWQVYETRMRRSTAVRFPDKDKRPIWTGRESLDGKTLLVHAEQGMGDTIQFCRYLRLAAARGGKVIFAAPPRLLRLLEPIKQWAELADQTQPLPDADYHILLISLPLALRTSMLAEPIPYLAAEPERVTTWRARIGDDGFKIGIFWNGHPHNPMRNRDFPLALFAGIGRRPGVRLISLQQGAGIEQLEHLPAGMTVETFADLDAGPHGFLDTAAIMMGLDLVITSDTATAHLAGALNRTCWVALARVPEWRWQFGRADSPWYPSLRLFRQTGRGDWASVFAQMEAALAEALR